jgi:dihydroxy-acid dehydratase
MEVEELLRSLPCDGVVILAGCDKTTPGTLMGAFSMDIPTLFCPAGPMLNDRYVKDGVSRSIGAGTHTRIFWDEYQAGKIDAADLQHLESRMTRAPGTCNTMGTASTMTSMVEALGLTLPGASSIPAMDSAHTRMATSCGERIVEMVWEDLKPPMRRCTSSPWQDAWESA